MKKILLLLVIFLTSCSSNNTGNDILTWENCDEVEEIHEALKNVANLYIKDSKPTDSWYKCSVTEYEDERLFLKIDAYAYFSFHINETYDDDIALYQLATQGTCYVNDERDFDGTTYESYYINFWLFGDEIFIEYNYLDSEEITISGESYYMKSIPNDYGYSLQFNGGEYNAICFPYISCERFLSYYQLGKNIKTSLDGGTFKLEHFGNTYVYPEISNFVNDGLVRGQLINLSNSHTYKRDFEVYKVTDSEIESFCIPIPNETTLPYSDFRKKWYPTYVLDLGSAFSFY